MVDHIRQKVLLIAVLFISAYVVSTSLSAPSKTNAAAAAHNATLTPALVVYQGTWTAMNDTQLFGRLHRHSGLMYLQMKSQAGSEEKEEAAMLFDGFWESDEMYTLKLENSTIDTGSTFSATVFSRAGKLLDLPNLSASLLTHDSALRGHLQLSSTPLFSFDLAVFTSEQRKQPRIQYSFLTSLLCTVQIFAFVKHSQAALNSEQEAKKTSKLFLFVNVVIDATLSVWSLGLAFEELDTFDYLVLAAFWHFASFVLLQSRVLAITWRAHYSGPETVRTKQGFEAVRHQYSLFYSKLCAAVVLSLAGLFAWNGLNYWGVAALSWLFVPQILVSAIYGYREALKPVVYVPLGLSRIAFLLYMFGCPANFLKREPSYYLAGGLSLFILLQMAILAAQNSKLGPKFFVPMMFRKGIYTYYRRVDEERGMEDVLFT